LPAEKSSGDDFFRKNTLHQDIVGMQTDLTGLYERDTKNWENRASTLRVILYGAGPKAGMLAMGS
jgi:hypothetical protein